MGEAKLTPEEIRKLIDEEGLKGFINSHIKEYDADPPIGKYHAVDDSVLERIAQVIGNAVAQAYEEAAEVAKRRGKWETASQIRALKDSLVQQSDVGGARH